jgi:hypothetical protein
MLWLTATGYNIESGAVHDPLRSRQLGIRLIDVEGDNANDHGPD